MARSKRQVINVTFHPAVGPRPGIITLAQRHLEKSGSAPISGDRQVAQYVVPIDLVRMAGTEALTQGIRSVTIGYRKRG